MFLDNLRLIFTNGNVFAVLSGALWPKSGHFGEGLSDYISMLAYVYEMADCYLASKFHNTPLIPKCDSPAKRLWTIRMSPRLQIDLL